MKLRGTTSVLAAAVAVGLVAMVGASSEEQVIEAVPAPAVVKSPPAPAPGIGHARNAMREAFGEDFADPLGVYSMTGGYETWVVPGDEDLGFDPYNAPTPEVIQPDGQEALQPVVVPLPLAPASIPVTTVESVGREKPGALLSQPVRGRSSSKFGMRFHPVLRVYKLHTGHDWAAPCGTAVGAAAAGTVVGTGWAGGNGVQVKIDHGTLGGYRVVTTYNHLSSIGVKVGQKVSALQGVGRVGSTGYSTGCHLHFEVIVNGQFTDPLPWLNGKPGIVDLSKMMSVVPTGPSSPGLSPSASPSVTGSPTVGQSPSRGTTEPPA
ncbi:M23 family metallopeptidase, partial [Tessaracoccus lubricantis]